MEEIRRKRYIEKINHIKNRASNAESWKEDLLRDEKTRLACYKAMQEVIEGCMDILSMILKDEKEIPKDDYSNISLAEKKGLLKSGICNALRELNGLRNRLVHEYNGLDDRIALDSIDELLPKIENFSAWARKWLEKKMK